jgi:hypothetical protein
VGIFLLGFLGPRTTRFRSTVKLGLPGGMHLQAATLDAVRSTPPPLLPPRPLGRYIRQDFATGLLPTRSSLQQHDEN